MENKRSPAPPYAHDQTAMHRRAGLEPAPTARRPACALTYALLKNVYRSGVFRAFCYCLRTVTMES